MNCTGVLHQFGLCPIPVLFYANDEFMRAMARTWGANLGQNLKIEGQSSGMNPIVASASEVQAEESEPLKQGTATKERPLIDLTASEAKKDPTATTKRKI